MTALMASMGMHDISGIAPLAANLRKNIISPWMKN